MIEARAFQTRARTVDHLGREQIADCPTAISELWKNAFDAYARNVELNIHDAVKAATWRSDFGTVQVVTAAVLGGVYALRNLVDAQERGLTLFWVHDLAAMIDWMRSADPAAGSPTG